MLGRFPLRGHEEPQPIFFTGHANGQITEWFIAPSGSFTKTRQIDTPEGSGAVRLLAVWLPRQMAAVCENRRNFVLLFNGLSEYPAFKPVSRITRHKNSSCVIGITRHAG